MKEALRVINDLEAQGFISRYAIGGAVAALFYAEPVDTEDLDIFVHLDVSDHPLMPMANLYAELHKRGFKKDGIYDVIEGVPVQFLPDSPELIREAVFQARDVVIDSVPTKVPTLEHLIAIMVLTGRTKDRLRVLMVHEQAKVDENKLADILDRYQLRERYEQWKKIDGKK